MKMKKIISAFLSVATLVTMSVPVFAAKNANKMTSDPQVSAELKFVSYADSVMTLELYMDSDVFTDTDSLEEMWNSEDEEYFYDAVGVYTASLVYNFKDGYATAISNPKAAKTANWYGSKQDYSFKGNLVGNRFTIGGTASGCFRYFGDDYAASQVKITLASSVTTGKTAADIQQMFENNELGSLESLSIDIIGNGPETVGSESILTCTTVGTKADISDYAFKSLSPAVGGSTPTPTEPVVPEYETGDNNEIMDTKAGTYAAEPTVDDTGKGLYWLINFKQGAADQYISADIQRFNSTNELLKQQSILVKLDDDGDSDKFVGEGNRAAYIFMENVPAGKYKGKFYISATGKPADRSLLFADEDFIVVE